MREDIKERIELIKCGKVPKGYKKTKLGIIPEDWEVVRIQDILEKIDNPVEVKADEEYTQIGIRSHGKGIFYKEPVTGKETRLITLKISVGSISHKETVLYTLHTG